MEIEKNENRLLVGYGAMIRNKLKLSNRQWDTTSSAGESVALRSKLIEITVKRQLSVVAVPLSQSRDTLYITSLYTVQ